MPTKAKENEKVKKTTKSTKETKPRATKKNTTAKKATTTKKATTAKKTTTKKESVAKKTTTKKAAPKKEVAEKKETKKATKIAKKEPAVKKETKTTKTTKATKTTATRKTTAKKATTAKKTTTKKAATAKKATAKKAATKKAVTKKNVVPSSIEYYDLPNNYNQTMVRVLFQTPKKLFVYWEISEADRAKLLEEHGQDFFYHSTPYLVVRNDTKNYSFEIEINDFANSWYFDVPDSKCDYSVELIRKHHETNTTIPIRSSNELEVPNNHILFEQNRREIFFINVKNNNVYSKNIANLQFIKHLGIARPITLNAFYNKFYDDIDFYDINNPSSYINHEKM